MKNLFRLIIGIALLATLSGCGNQSASTGVTVVQKLRTSLSARKQVPLTTADLRARLTPEVHAQIGRPVMITELPKIKVASVIIYTEENAGYVTWLTPDSVGVTTYAGLVTATRGIGFDLMSADVSDAYRALTGKKTASTGRRIHRYLDGEDKIVPIRFDCSYIRQPDRNGFFATESCVSGKTRIENQYWLDKKRRIVKSVQWMGQRNGYILTEGPILPPKPT